jgi:TM2 domain-containing membrane protein YozV
MELPAMTESIFSPPVSSHSEQQSRTHWGKAFLAGFLSLLIPGMGQLYNRQPRKAIGIALTMLLLSLIMARTRILLSFWSLVLILGISIVWRLFVLAEAAYTAALERNPEPSFPRPRLTYILICIAILLFQSFPTSSGLYQLCIDCAPPR